MPVTTLPQNPPGGADAGLSEADRAAERMLAQSRSESLKPDVDPARESALDEAFAATDKDAPAGELGSENNGVKTPLEGAPLPEAKPKADAPKPEDKPADPVPKPEDKPADPKPDDGSRKSLLDDLLGDKPAADAPPADPAQKAFDDVKLRSDASPKTQETFANLKKISLEHIAAARAEAEKERTAKAELEAKLKAAEEQAGKLTPEVEAELKELREFRALRDVESRPEIKEKFDSRIAGNLESVYTLFKGEGMSETVLASLKGLSEDARNDYIEKNVLPNLTSSQRRMVEAKLLDNVNTLDERRRAVEAARADADKILAEQREAPQRQQQEFVTKVAGHLRPLLGSLKYFHLQEVPTTATAAEKAELEASNQHALQLQELLKRAITEDTPESRAEAALAVPISRHLKVQLDRALARASAAEEKLGKIQAASATGSRLGKSAAPATDATPKPKAQGDTDSESEIDRLFRENQPKSP